ncbi:Rab5-interacting protein-domain-containing protein [Daedaleopsis nitida]|nr:Rab5-interacting protein-domain-containing protein [Daedaleopsis nitida]
MSATTSTPEAAAQLLFPPNVQYNNSRLYTVKFLSSCFAGAVAGVLGLENTLGFALFIFSTLLTSSCLYLKCKGRPSKYVPGGWWELVNPGQENIFSFVLVWTLFYGTPVALSSRVLRCDGSVGRMGHRNSARCVLSM